MYFYNFIFIFIIFASSLHADIKYKQGWNLLGGELSLSNVGDEEIWAFIDSRWVLRPSKIKKHQGFWFNAPTSGVLKTYEHSFEQILPSIYSLHSMVIQYVDLNKEVEYTRDDFKDSYIKINKDLSFEEFVKIKIDNLKPLSYMFRGKFMPLANNTTQIVEYDNASNNYYVSSIMVDTKILVIIRQEVSAKYGVINKKYIYTRE